LTRNLKVISLNVISLNVMSLDVEHRDASSSIGAEAGDASREKLWSSQC
jgi:hypothetical protein